MNAVPFAKDAVAPVSGKPAVPFATVYITLTKKEHIQPVMDANTCEGLHRKATERAEWRERRRQHEFRRATKLAVSAELLHQEAMREFTDQAGHREAALRAQLEVAHFKARDLGKRLFGCKSEPRGGGKGQVQSPVSRPPRGLRVGVAGHERTMQSQLPERVELAGAGAEYQ